jgi:hypothetical protein
MTTIQNAANTTNPSIALAVKQLISAYKSEVKATVVYLASFQDMMKTEGRKGYESWETQMTETIKSACLADKRVGKEGLTVINNRIKVYRSEIKTLIGHMDDGKSVTEDDYSSITKIREFNKTQKTEGKGEAEAEGKGESEGESEGNGVTEATFIPATFAQIVTALKSRCDTGLTEEEKVIARDLITSLSVATAAPKKTKKVA